jgi:hypothetical protein
MTKPMISAAMALLVACGSPARTPTAPPLTDTIDQLLAPIALYPDQLLAQMLMSDRSLENHRARQVAEVQHETERHTASGRCR